MKALVHHEPGQKAWEDVPKLEISADTDALVRVDATAQSAAIAAIDGNLQLIACVGSGKDWDVLAGHPVGPAHQT
jgi:hypothetical protein